MPESITDDRLNDAINRSVYGLDNLGFCLACGEEQDDCDPDAREDKCEHCGEHKVYGIEEILLMFYF